MSRGLMVSWLLILAGCATIPPQQRAAIAENAAMHVTCSGAEDCELKWGRALDWVQRNSTWKLQNVSDLAIITEDPHGSNAPAFEVTKFPLGDGSYEFRFRAWCQMPFGCPIPQLTASFNSSVMRGHP